MLWPIRKSGRQFFRSEQRFPCASRLLIGVKVTRLVKISAASVRKHSGTIRSLSLTPMAPALLPQERKAGLYANMFGEQPLYRADIGLDTQVISIDHETVRSFPA